MRDAYDRLRAREGWPRMAAPRYLASPLATIPGASAPVAGGPATAPATPLAPSAVAGPNSQTFRTSGEAGVERGSNTVTPGSGASVILMPSPAPWPPAGSYYHRAPAAPIAVSNMVAEKRYATDQAGNEGYYVALGMMRFDTSPLPDNAQIATATLKAYVYALQRGQIAGHDRLLTFEWASWTDIDADWTATEGTSAHVGVPLKNLPLNPSWVEIPLTNPAANVSRTSPTSLKFHISGGDPEPDVSTTPDPSYGGLQVDYYAVIQGSYMFSAQFAPQLVVTYQ